MSIRDNIQNYFEAAVVDEIIEQVNSRQLALDAESLADIACLALNHLPPRYVRHNVDTMFYMTVYELENNKKAVVKAVSDALDYVQSHRRPVET